MTTLSAEGVVFPEGEEGELNKAIKLLDDSNELFYRAAFDYSRWPAGAKQMRMGETAQYVAEAFRIAAQSIALTEEDPAAQSKMIFELLLSEDAKRVNSLNGISGREILKPTTLREQEDSVLEAFQAGLEIDITPGTEDKRLEQPLASYINCMNADLGVFQNHIRVGRRAKALELGSTGAKHALGIGKAAVGAGIAIYAIKWLEKKGSGI